MKSLKTITVTLLIFCGLIGCSNHKEEDYYAVEVANKTSIDMVDRMIAIDLDDIQDAVPQLAETEKFIVRNALGEELQYQKCNDPLSGRPQILVSVDVKANRNDTITIKAGQPLLDKRYVEVWDENEPVVRWSNDLSAYALPVNNSSSFIYLGPSDQYGKAADQAFVNQSISANQTAISGTLGFGDAAFMSDDNKLLTNERKISSVKVLENGPLRIVLEVQYEPVMVGEQSVSENRIIVCDANSLLLEHYSRYSFEGAPLELAIGVAANNSKEADKVLDLKGVIAYTYKHTNAAVGAYTGIILANGFDSFLLLPQHLVGLLKVNPNEVVHFLTANDTHVDSGISFDKWVDKLQRELNYQQNPLTLTRVRY